MNSILALALVILTNVAPASMTSVIPGTIHTVVPTRQARFTKVHVASGPVTRHVWEVTDSEGCITRPIEGNANGGTVRYCSK